MSVNVWARTSARGRRDPDDSEVVTVDWATLDGIEIIDVDVVGGSLLSVKFRVPAEVERRMAES